MYYSFFSACSEVHDLNIGFIRSPLNFPSNYPNYVNCHYLIMNSDPATRITLNFLHFDLDHYQNQWNETIRCNDFVKIYDGNSTKATQIGRRYGYCGKRAPPTLTIASTGNSLLIVFFSHGWSTKSGFSATYRGRKDIT